MGYLLGYQRAVDADFLCRLIGSGSPYAVPAGHYPKLDHVTAHYRQKYAEEEERKVKKLLQKQEQEQALKQEQP